MTYDEFNSRLCDIVYNRKDAVLALLLVAKFVSHKNASMVSRSEHLAAKEWIQVIVKECL